MIRVEGHWETVNSFRDISKIIREYYNIELADKMDELIDDELHEMFVIGKEEIEDKLERLEDLEDLIEQIRDIVW